MSGLFELSLANPTLWIFVACTSPFLAIAVVIYICDCRVFDANGKRIPSPTNHLWGNFSYSVLKKQRQLKRISKYIYELMTEVGDGSIAGVNLFGRSLVIMAHPEMVKVVLSGLHTKFPKNVRYNRTKFIFGEGLVTSSGHKWQNDRHMINSTFHAESLKDMVKIFDSHSKRQVSKWLSHMNNNFNIICNTEERVVRVDLCSALNKLTLDVICQSAFGCELSELDSKQLSHDLEAVLDEVNIRLVDVTEWSHRLNPTRVKRTEAATSRMQSIVQNIVNERVEKHGNCVQKNAKNTERGSDLLDLLLEGAKNTSQQSAAEDKEVREKSNPGVKCASDTTTVVSPQDLRDHILTFLLAGHETTSSTLMWTLYELCMHPEIQELCFEEIDGVLRSRKNKNDATTTASATATTADEKASPAISASTEAPSIEYEDISRFEYLSQVIKETLRLHPTIPMIARENVEEVELGEYHLRAHSNLLVNVMAVHRHPDFWERPNDFMPSRFAKEEQRKTIKHPFQYIPFSAGPRNCIGQRFAQMEMTVILANLLSAYTFSLSEEDKCAVRFEETITFHPVNFFVHVTRRC